MQCRAFALGFVLSLSSLAACERPAPAPPATPTQVATPPPAEPTAAAPATAAAACDALSRAQCLSSTACTLHHVEGAMYACKPEVGACETGLVQHDKPGCEARPGCTFTPASCYCACEGAGRTATVAEPGAGCDCVCGGGPPAACRPSS